MALIAALYTVFDLGPVLASDSASDWGETGSVGSGETEWIGSAGKTTTIGSYGDADSSNSGKKWVGLGHRKFWSSVEWCAGSCLL